MERVPANDRSAVNIATDQEGLPTQSDAESPDTGELSSRQQAESQWLVNEFNGLRQEFIERFRTENLLVLGAVTFLGTILSIAFKDATQTNVRILSVLPIVMPLTGIFYINQRLSNTAIGLYVRDYLRPRVNSMLKTKVLEWEEYVRSKSSPVKELTVFGFILLVFASPSFTVLALTYPMRAPKTDGFAYFTWWSGAVLSIIWTVLWISQFRKWLGSHD